MEEGSGTPPFAAAVFSSLKKRAGKLVIGQTRRTIPMLS